MATDVIKMIHSGPIPTKTLKHYFQANVYPETVPITSVMVMNVKARALRLAHKFRNNPSAMSLEGVRNLFNPDSLENAPKNWHSDPIYANVYKECMFKVLSDNDAGGVFPIVKVVEKIKEKQPKGYDFGIYYAINARPCGVMQMTPAQSRAFLRWGDLCAIDAQEKMKNLWGWVGTYPAGYIGNNKLQNYCNSLTLESDNRFLSWTIKNM